MDQPNQSLIALGEDSRVKELNSIDINWIELQISILEGK